MAYSKPRPIDCVFYRPNQTSTPNPPVGNQRKAVSAPDAGGGELQPRPVGTVSGGEGQAGTGLVSSHRSRKLFQNSATYKEGQNIMFENVAWMTRIDATSIGGMWLGVRRNAPSLARSATTSPHGL